VGGSEYDHKILYDYIGIKTRERGKIVNSDYLQTKAPGSVIRALLDEDYRYVKLQNKLMPKIYLL